MSQFGLDVSSKQSIGTVDSKDMDYTSRYQSPKIKEPISGKFTTNASGDAEVYVPHDLPYSPIVLGYYYDDNVWKSVDNVYVGIESSSYRIRIMTDGLTANKQYLYKLFIFADPLSIL
jgi:hypothetical protein